MTEDRDWGAEIVPVSPPHSAESRASLQRTKEVIGKRINCYAYRPKVFLSGSPMLGRIFTQGTEFRLDKSGCGSRRSRSAAQRLRRMERFRITPTSGSGWI